MTRWLDDDEKLAWRRYIAATRLVEDALDRQLRSDAQMPHSYYEVLVRLSAQPDRTMRMSDLAERTLSSRSRLSHAVGKLEGLGWVERSACPTDRRGLLARLTDAGMAALAEAAPGHVEEVRRRLLDPLSDEQVGQLSEICRTIIDGFELDLDAVAGLTD